MENLNSQNNRITVRVPFSVLEVIDRIVLNKVNDVRQMQQEVVLH